ncbi:hypothetical protein UlMin_025117 [Ulmus minor]
MAGGKMRSEASSSSKSSNSRTNDDERGKSKVVDWGRNRTTCGYCKSSGRTRISHGLWAHSLTVNDYQALLDRGWRRSGSFLYKPEMERTCCPSYTIRLRVGDFVPNKEQLRVTRRIQRYLDGNLDCNTPLKLKKDLDASKETSSFADHGVSNSAVKEFSSSNNAEKDGVYKILDNLSDKIDKAMRTCVDSGEFPNDIQLPKASVKRVLQGKRKLFVEGSEDLLFSSNIAFQIAAAIKRAQSGMKDVQQSRESKDMSDEKVCPKAVAEKLASSLNQLGETGGLLVRACNGHMNFYSGAKQSSLYGSDEVVTASQGPAASRESTSQTSSPPPVKRRRLEIHLKRSSFDPEEFALYRRYQIKVHNDTPDHVTESSYKRFLVDSPLIYVPPTGDGTVPPCGFGSFHQQYVIDGKLVAVGVIDILPKCLSSKYLFWDPDFAFLSLGKYSAMQEINWVKENQIHCPSLQYYYLGYYIHSCNKMRYKAAYRPSELLCPLRYQWVSFDIARPWLDRKRYVVLSDCTTLQDGVSSAPNVSEDVMESQHDDITIEGSSDVEMYQNEEALDPEDESSEDESGTESSGTESVQIENGDNNSDRVEGGELGEIQ